MYCNETKILGLLTIFDASPCVVTYYSSSSSSSIAVSCSVRVIPSVVCQVTWLLIAHVQDAFLSRPVHSHSLPAISSLNSHSWPLKCAHEQHHPKRILNLPLP